MPGFQSGFFSSSISIIARHLYPVIYPTTALDNRVALRPVYTNFYLPAVVLLSTQIDDAIAERYQAERWLLLTGMVSGATTESTYAFCREVVGYDLAAFFERNSRVIKSQIETILKAILTA